MTKVQLTEQERKVYDLVIRTGTMEDMFELGYSLGRARHAQEHQNNNTGCNNSGSYNSGNRNSGDYNSGNRNSGYHNNGNHNNGSYNSGYHNSGYHNSGHYNTGDRNSGYGNSGDYNGGNYNNGDYNSGDYNSGDYNSRDCNTGDYNSGSRNTGYYNSGNNNSGWFNTNEPKMRFFNQDSGLTYSEFSKNLDRVVYPDLKVCAWVSLKDLPENEKDEDATQRGGTLKTLSYKEAWAEYWSRSSQEDKKWFMDLPNFDPEIFKEITGIQVVDKAKSLSGKTVKVEIDGQSYEAIIK